MVSATTSCGCFAKTLARFAALIAERKRSAQIRKFRSCETGVFILHPVHGSTYPPNFCSKARNICLLFNKGNLAWAAIGRRLNAYEALPALVGSPMGSWKVWWCESSEANQLSVEGKWWIMDCPKNGTDYLPLYVLVFTSKRYKQMVWKYRSFSCTNFTDLAAKFWRVPLGWNPRALNFSRGFRHYEYTSILDGLQVQVFGVDLLNKIHKWVEATS